jgi:hypothetical protein
VRDLIAAGDKQNLYKNDRWLTNEELSNGQWDEGKNQFQQASEFANERKGGARKGAVVSQPDFGDVRDR